MKGNTMKRILCFVLSVLALGMLPGCKSATVDPATGREQIAPPEASENMLLPGYGSGNGTMRPSSSNVTPLSTTKPPPLWSTVHTAASSSDIEQQSA